MCGACSYFYVERERDKRERERDVRTFSKEEKCKKRRNKKIKPS